MNPLVAFVVLIGGAVLSIYVTVLRDRHRDTQRRLAALEKQVEEVVNRLEGRGASGH